MITILPTTAREWNDRFPRGTRVKFYPNGKRDGASAVETKTRGGAYHLGSGKLIVPLECGKSVHVGQIELVPTSSPAVALAQWISGGAPPIHHD